MQFELNANTKHQNVCFKKYSHHVLSIVAALHHDYINGMDAVRVDSPGGSVGMFRSVCLVEAGGSRADEEDLYKLRLISAGVWVWRGAGPGSPCPSARCQSMQLAPCPGPPAPGTPAWSPRQLREPPNRCSQPDASLHMGSN